jgi:hypothetical protein
MTNWGVRMGRTKYSDRFCAYCNKETRMVLVGAMEGVQDKTWFRCTRCHHTALLDEESIEKARWQLDPSHATVYNPWQSFQIGESIFHQEWNEVGKVLSKMKTSDGNQAIIVSFEKSGQRRLIENLKPEIPVESEIVP